MALYDLMVRFQETVFYWALLVFFAWYPLTTSAMWIFTSTLFHRRREAGDQERHAAFYAGAPTPSVSIVIPAFNEERSLERTLAGVLAVDYPDLEIVIVDDCSTDGTLARIEPFLIDHRVRLVRKQVNEGKAMALNDAIPLTRGELVLIQDADAVPDPQILRYLVPHFRFPRCAAVTGNPRVANRDSFLAKLQAIEFASIVSVMRRAQRIWGRIMTMSGVIGIFRRQALLDVGLFNPEMATEDIDLTWRLQMRHWDIRYESRAVIWMRVPQSLAGLVRQRRRWALGLSQVQARHTPHLLRWRQRRLWPVLLESSLSVAWAYTYVFLTLVWLISFLVGYPPLGVSPIPSFWGMLVATMCLLQLTTGVVLDNVYDRDLKKIFFVAVFYPLVYWMLMAVTTVVTAPAGLAVDRQKRRVTLWKPVRE